MIDIDNLIVLAKRASHEELASTLYALHVLETNGVIPLQDALLMRGPFVAVLAGMEPEEEAEFAETCQMTFGAGTLGDDPFSVPPGGVGRAGVEVDVTMRMAADGVREMVVQIGDDLRRFINDRGEKEGKFFERVHDRYADQPSVQSILRGIYCEAVEERRRRAA